MATKIFTYGLNSGVIEQDEIGNIVAYKRRPSVTHIIGNLDDQWLGIRLGLNQDAVLALVTADSVMS